MGMPVSAKWDQDRFQFFKADNASWASCTAWAALNTNPTSIPIDQTFIVWFGVEETAGSGSSETPTFYLYYRVNSGTWTGLPYIISSNPVRSGQSPILPNGVTAISQRITTGTYRDGDALDNFNTAAAVASTNALAATAGNDWYEAAFTVIFNSGAGSPVSPGDTVEFQLRVTDGNLNTTTDGDLFTTNGGTYTNTPNITVARKATWDQDSFQFYTDDAAPASSTARAAVNTNPTDLVLDTSYQLRFLVQETNNSQAAETPTFRLRYRINQGGGFGAWTTVAANGNTTSPVRCNSSPNFSDGDAIAQRIGAGTFRAGQAYETDTAGNQLTATAGNDEYEVLWSIFFDSNNTTAAQVGDIVEFAVQLTPNAGAYSDTDTVTNTPSITISSGVTPNLAGSTSVTFSTSASILGSGQLLGSTSLTFTPSGTILGSGQLAGSTGLTFTPSGAILGLGLVVGSSNLVFTPAGTIVGSGQLLGSSSLTFTPSGIIFGSGQLAGSTSLTFTPSGTILGSGQLTGSSSLTFTLSGVASSIGALAGSTSLVFTPSGTIFGSGVLSGSANLIFTTSGTIAGAGALSGSTSITFSLAGIIFNDSASFISGSTSLTFSTEGILVGTGELVGSTNLSFSPTGILFGSGALSGSASLLFSATGLLEGAGALQGSTNLTFSPSGSGLLFRFGSGSSSITFIPVGVLSGTGAIAGTSNLTFTQNGVIFGIGTLSGSTSISFLPEGFLSADALIAGATNLVFTTSGTLFDLSGGPTPSANNYSLLRRRKRSDNSS